MLINNFYYNLCYWLFVPAWRLYSIRLMLIHYTSLRSSFYNENANSLCQFWGSAFMVRVLSLYYKYMPIWLPFKLVKKYCVRWRSRSAINFGWHYAIISTNLLKTRFENPAQHHDSDLIVTWNCHKTIIKLIGNQSISISLLVLGHLYANLDVKLLCSKI